MLFNSYEYLFVFLPIVALGYFAIGNIRGHRVAIAWLVTASLFFYGWWNPVYLFLIGGSILFNFYIGNQLGHRAESPGKSSKALLITGISANLFALGYFKYAGFMVENLNYVIGTQYHVDIILPLAISFFTFQQISFLVDAYKGLTKDYDFTHYCLFVTFFPQLIAGPIVHHKEMMPQFARDSVYKPNFNDIAAGITIIVIGLFKKVVIADSVAMYSDQVFYAADQGREIWSGEAWGAAMAYTVQLYFDFSGYVDMAIGSARIFGIRLPINFYSPYKALNISDFWRRWHMTLSRFLRDHLYIPLGGSRAGRWMTYRNLMITMVLGGLWHGASWTFVAWGGLHGASLLVVHRWQEFRAARGLPAVSPHLLERLAAWWLCFLVVVVAWVLFRAETFSGAATIISAMFGNGLSHFPDSFSGQIGGLEAAIAGVGIRFDGHLIVPLRDWVFGFAWIAGGMAVALFYPNMHQIFDENEPSPIKWQATPKWLALTCVLFVIALLHMFRVSPFLYFNF